jgi:hypothetical protein
VIRIFLIDAVGNLALFGLAYYWLGLSAGSTGALALSAVLAIVLAALAAYLIAFGFNRDAKAAVSKIPVMLLWLFAAGIVALILKTVWSYAGPIDNWINSALTLATRKPIQFEYMRTVFAAIAFLLFAAILLPAAARAAATGSLFDIRPVSGRGYLLSFLVYVFIGLWLPWTLFWWIPRVDSLTGQTASFLARMLLAFTLYVGAWLIFAWHCRAKALAPESQHSR